MTIPIRKQSAETWQLPPKSLKLKARKRADCVIREVKCSAKQGAVRAALERAVAAEIDRMRASQESEEAVRAFRAATDIHIALCGPDVGA